MVGESIMPLNLRKSGVDGSGVIAVDLDGTLAKYTEWKGIEYIGPPIPKMLKRVKKWLKEGREVRIFTARATEKEAVPYIEQWLETNGIGGLEITSEKARDIVEIWDDRAIQVVPNTGERIDGED